MSASDPSGRTTGGEVPAREESERCAAFRDAMSRLAAGVVVVTNWFDERAWGLTVSACCSVSISPPTLLVCLQSQTVSAKGILTDGRFGVSVLGKDKLEVAQRASKRGADKFIDAYCLGEREADAYGTPVVSGGLAHLDCRLERSIEHGDHVIMIGDVLDVLLWGEGEPLLYFNRAFRELDTGGIRRPAPVWWGMESVLEFDLPAAEA